MKHILIIGGTRNLGHMLALALLAEGHRVTVLNRGRTTDELPPEVERLRADRTQAPELERTLAGRSFDAVVDTALYTGDEAKAITRLLNGQTDHYIFLSTGQVYLVREGVERPFDESMYAGRVMPAPKKDSFAYTEWLYGVQKREAEDWLLLSWEAQKFPFTSLRIPMVNSERDHFFRLYNYILRLKDGGPILVPANPNHPLRHIYGGDVVQAIQKLIARGPGQGQAYNISQEETLALDDFLQHVATLLGVGLDLRRYERPLLEREGYLPDCSPFSERWMSALTNNKSKTELGIQYTPLQTYLAKITAYYQTTPPALPHSYARRQDEITFAERHS